MGWRPGWPEIILILVVVVLLFGPNRIAKIAKELGSGIRNFKDGLSGKKEEEQGSEKPTDKDEDKP